MVILVIVRFLATVCHKINFLAPPKVLLTPFLPYCCAGHHHKFGPQSRNLGSIVRGFKIGVTKYAHRQNIEFFWQARFYEHIIKTDEALRNIRGYIKNNPLNWARDRNKLE